MAWDDRLLISGFCDEICIDKRLDAQLSVCAALGMEFVTLRFLDVGNGIQNVLQLSDEQVALAKKSLDGHGLRVSSIGSPIGKVKLLDVDDGTNNRYRQPREYLDSDVRRACELANRLDCRLVRGFSFYHPAGTDPLPHVAAAADRLAPIVELCGQHGLTFGLEVEANLIGQNGGILAELFRQISLPALTLIFDGANLITQGYSTEEVYDQWTMMKPGIGWIHVKDYLPESGLPGSPVTRQIDEEGLNRFVPAGDGASGYGRIFQDVVESMPEFRSRLESRGIPGLFLDLEPHVLGGGQFGGYSGAFGFGNSLRSLCKLLDQSGAGYRLRG